MPPRTLREDTENVAAPTAKAAAPLSRKRRIVIWTLVVLASVLALVSILTTWVNRQVLDNTAWNKATTQIVQDPKVQTAIATYAVNQLYANVNVGQALSKLPAKAGTLTLMKSDQLSAAQTGVQALRVLSAWLLVAVLALYGVAIWLARG